ncbi:sporangiospore maturation cell wall hydrolase GsmA [Actinoplanes sp. NPDC049265]|uniref:sporangiospore maturation cell wall hydrolase GsmA n=1 Tax=Actinoplanes sp. NPDC049265 TaxID=3363902 RepID=UPI0037246BAF
MPHTARRLLTSTLLVAAVGAGLATAPAAANAATVSATVRVNSNLKVRATPSLSGSIVGSVRDNQKIAVLCVTSGTSVQGSIRTSNLWARLGTGRYISFAYVATTKAIGRCATTTPQAVPVKNKPATTTASKYITGKIRSSSGPVNVRTAPNTSGNVVLKLNNGRQALLVCAVTGQSVAGTVRTTTQWDRTSTGLYLSHAYVISPALPTCAGSTTPPATSPSVTPEQFIKAAVPGAQQGWREYGVPPSVTIAQAILESGWGRSTLSSTHRNYFGIKCQNGRYGTIANGCQTYKTQECTKAGKCYDTTGVFRTYSSMANSFRDHGNFLKVNSRYKPAFAYTKNANKFIWTVWKAGYATDPNYYTKITGIMASNKLYQYDTWK